MDEKEIIEETIATISQLMGELETQAFQQQGFSDLSMRQLLYLETIAQLEQPTFSDLADQLEVSRPSVSAVIRKLKQNGYVRKIQSPEDGRVYHILLTPKGQALSAMHDNIHRILAERLMSNLSKDETEQLAALLRKILPQS